MNRLHRRCYFVAAIAASFVLAGATLEAAIVEDFQFSDPNGTAITAATNSANAGNAWLSQNTAINASVQSGVFRIQKGGEGAPVTGQVSNALNIANVTTGKVWLVADISGWNYTPTASTPSERIRFGFLDNNDPPAAGSSTITAEMTIDRGSNNDLILSGEALGTGSTNIAADQSLALFRELPLSIVLELDKVLDQYSVYYKDGAAPYALLGTADLARAR